MFPPNIIATIGSFLDVGSRQNTQLAGKMFANIHESETRHNICMSLNDDPNKINNIMRVLRKLKPLTNELFITFTLSPKHEYDASIAHLFKDLRVYVFFEDCDFPFVAWTLGRIPFKVWKCSICLKNDYSLFGQINKAVDDVVNSQPQCWMRLILWDNPLHYTILLHPIFSKMILGLEMNITNKNTLPVDIDLDRVMNAEFINLFVDKLSRVRSIKGIEKVTSLWLNTVNHSFTIGFDLVNNHRPLKLKQLTIEHPDITNAYDSDSAISHLLENAKINKEECILQFVNVCDPDMPAFIHHVFEHHKYKHVGFVINSDMDLVCAKVLQLMYPLYDLKITICSDDVDKGLENLTCMKELYECMDMECKWTWYMIKMHEKNP